MKFNLLMALDVLFCKDLMVTVENSPVNLSRFSPNKLLSLYGMGSWYWAINKVPVSWWQIIKANQRNQNNVKIRKT